MPDECCITWTKGCGQGIGNQNENEAARTIYTKGCFTSLKETIESNETTAIGFGVGVLFLLLIGVIIACCVGRSVGESRIELRVAGEFEREHKKELPRFDAM